MATIPPATTAQTPYLDRNGNPVKIKTVRAKGFPKSITDRKKKYGGKSVIGFEGSVLHKD